MSPSGSSRRNRRPPSRDRRKGRLDRLKSEAWRRSAAAVTTVIVGYFVASVGLTFFQKSLISHLRYPITIVTCHLVLKFVFAGICRSAWSAYTGKNRVVLGWSDYLSRVAAVAVFSALDIGLSQWSFEFITVALYTMTKTTSVLFILFFALLFGLEKKHWSLIATISMISGGLFLFVFRSTQFSLVGFLMALSASFLSGARWTLAQLIMQRGRLGLEHPVDFIYHLQPIMVLTVLPFAAGFEGIAFASSDQAFRFHDYSVLLHTVGMILAGGLLAFVMEVFEFFIIIKASSLTLSIIGITKEIVTIGLDVVVNGSELTWVNVVGVVICLAGIASHVYRKATDPDFGKGKRDNVRPKFPREQYSEFSLPLLSDDSDDSSDEDELFHPGGRVRLPRSASAPGAAKFREFDDEFYLRDQREWTSVRDSHVRSAADLAEGLAADDEGDVPQVLKEQEKGSRPPPPPPLADVDLLSD